MANNQLFEEQLENVLEALWVDREQNRPSLEDFRRKWGTGYTNKTVEIMLARGDLIKKVDIFEFTPDSYEKARAIIRRHRLTEVLFYELFGVNNEVFESIACKMEHVLKEPHTDSVCTFLGHPRYCPHGRPIPTGECCERLEVNITPLLINGMHMEVGKSYQVKYLQNSSDKTINRLINYGFTPGSVILLNQKKPSFVIKIGETELALDEEVIKSLYVKPWLKKVLVPHN